MQEERTKLNELNLKLHEKIKNTQFTQIDNDVKLRYQDYEEIMLLNKSISDTLDVIKYGDPNIDI